MLKLDFRISTISSLEKCDFVTHHYKQNCRKKHAIGTNWVLLLLLLLLLFFFFGFVFVFLFFVCFLFCLFVCLLLLFCQIYQNAPNFANWAHWVWNGNPPIDIEERRRKKRRSQGGDDDSEKVGIKLGINVDVVACSDDDDNDRPEI